MFAVLCDKNGTTLCGSDGVMRVDGRWNHDTTLRHVAEYRERFRKNFEWKFKAWTHVGFAQNLRTDKLSNIVPIPEVTP